MPENMRQPIETDSNMAQLNVQEAWSRSIVRIRAELGDSIFQSWFARLELDHYANGVVYCSVPTKFLKSWISSQFQERIEPIFAAEFPGLRNVAVSVRTSMRQPVRPSEKPAAPSVSAPEATRAASPESRASGARAVAFSMQSEPSVKSGAAESAAKFADIAGSSLDPRYTFENFLVGPSNQLAHAAAMEVARGGTAFNPLFFHASVGLGKTHLLQAIAHKAIELRRRVVYLTAEKFMYTFVSSLKDHTTIAFKEKLRNIDLLIIDDVQFLQGKSMQQEFSHTLNALFDAGRQVVAAADVPPSDLENHDERLRSRLSGGLCIELKSFDGELRHRIVENRISAARALQPGFEVPPAVVSYVASVIQTNGRDIEGAVNRLLAHTTFSGARLTVETAETAIRDLIRVRDPKRVKIDDILKLVSVHYNVSKPDLLSSRRTAVVVRPRQVAMYLAKILTLRSLPEIGRRFGGRDHTTVLHAVRKIERLARADNSLRDEVELLKRMLSE